MYVCLFNEERDSLYWRICENKNITVGASKLPAKPRG